MSADSEGTTLDCPLAPRQQTRNILIYGANWALIYLASPVTYVGLVQAALLKRFGSVTVLNGHIHQILQKVEGNMTFHTARSTAFPQPEPGKAASPGPIKNVAADQLRRMLGLTKVSCVEGKGALAVVDTTLEGA